MISPPSTAGNWSARLFELRPELVESHASLTRSQKRRALLGLDCGGIACGWEVMADESL